MPTAQTPPHHPPHAYHCYHDDDTYHVAPLHDHSPPPCDVAPQAGAAGRRFITNGARWRVLPGCGARWRTHPASFACSKASSSGEKVLDATDPIAGAFLWCPDM